MLLLNNLDSIVLINIFFMHFRTQLR